MLSVPVLTKVIRTFPSIQLDCGSVRLPIEVSLISQLGHGAGDQMFAGVTRRQRFHEQFVDELNEPSARIGAPNIAAGDATALYSFAVGPEGHPFHRHAGHRIFTAISGSAGAQLRFSTSDDRLGEDKSAFVSGLRLVNIPPDCLFTVRFGGGVWHQFAPLRKGARHPVMVALSCHSDELGGDLNDEQRAMIVANTSDIPSLTHLLPEALNALLGDDAILERTPTVSLSLDAPEGTLHRLMCNIFRGRMGTARQRVGSPFGTRGFVSLVSIGKVRHVRQVPDGSLLDRQLDGKIIDHRDSFAVDIAGVNLGDRSAEDLLDSILEGFIANPPRFVGRLMALRNAMVMPLGLRRSSLGCPVSSLIGGSTGTLFRGKYPVLDQRVDVDGARAEVVLGADDKHVEFRTCVAVIKHDPQQAEIRLENAVHCRNRFGHFYMAAIRGVHQRAIAPAMLRDAIEYALREQI